MKPKGILIVFVLLATCVTWTFAQNPGIVTSKKAGWHKIGETKADMKAENESILVLGADQFKSIKLKVTDAPLSIKTMQVFYEGGDMEEVNVGNSLKAGQETRVIDLKHPNADLQKVVFTYKTMPNKENEKAHVELYGLK